MFESIESTLYPIVCNINTYLSNYILVFLLLGVGLWYSIKTRFVQLRCFKEGWNSVFGNLSLNGKKHESGMSSFQALATAIAAQVGTGNIVGASGAILTGGPGAIFWMWLIAFFGMATIYAEATLAQETRIVEEDGNIKGGPVYYITTAFKGGLGKFLAAFFAIAITLALGFFGCMVQSNSIGSTCSTANPGFSMVIGICAGTLSTLGFSVIAPKVCKLIRGTDTCGVHNLHGMPGLLGGLFGIAITGNVGVQLGAVVATVVVGLVLGRVCGAILGLFGTKDDTYQDEDDFILE